MPSPLEEQLKLSPFIVNVMIYGENKPHNVVVVVPDMSSLERWAKHNGYNITDPTTDPRVKELLTTEIDRQAASFKSFERPRGMLIVTEDFTVENGILTPSLKIKRRVALAKYGKALDALYAK